MFFCLESTDKKIKNAILDLEREFAFQIGDSGEKLVIENADRFFVERRNGQSIIRFKNRVDVFVGLRYLLQTTGDFSCFPERKIENLSIMCDCSRNAVMSVDSVKRFIRQIAVMGYNQLMLYTEDTYEVDGEPYFGYLRGGYTKAELKELDAYAKLFGVTLIPCIQTLAHMDGLRNWTAEYRQVFDCGNILLVGDERVYQMLENMFASLRECFSTELINIGMDEAWLLGAGKFLAQNGYVERYDIMKAHLTRVAEIAQKYAFKPFVWSDMFLRVCSKSKDDYFGNDPIPQEIYKSVPQGIHLIYWDYYHEEESHYERMIDRHLGFGRELWFAGSSFTSYRFSADNVRALKAMIPAFNVCVKKGISTFCVTQWGDDGGDGSMFSSMRSLVKIASLNYNESEEEYARALFAVSGYTEDELLTLDFPNDRYLFYNDCFVGKYNTAIEVGYEKEYIARAKRLARPASKKGKLQYLFEARKAYCEVMELKSNLGNYTKEEYKQGKAALKKAVKTYKTLLCRVGNFYELFKAQWSRDNKPAGFEIQSVRIGGLMRRLQDCIQRMQAYIRGEVESIPELETKDLDVFGGKENIEWKLMEESVYYKDMVSVNFI